MFAIDNPGGVPAGVRAGRTLTQKLSIPVVECAAIDTAVKTRGVRSPAAAHPRGCFFLGQRV